MFDVKPIKKNDPNNPGKKFDDFWEAGQKVGASILDFQNNFAPLIINMYVCMYAESAH